MNLIKEIKDSQKEMMQWRHLLHRSPELAFEEHKTAAFIERQLQRAHIPFTRIAGTGVVGVLHGKSGAGGKSIMLRADMDALPIREQSGAAYTSLIEGKMHGCGHDGHMAMLLAAARHLQNTQNFDGTVYVVFQPAEEAKGGAAQMIREDFFQKFPCDEVYGLHNFPNLPLGMMATMAGDMLAASNEFTVTLSGVGGHSARPELATDLMGAMAQMILDLKSGAAKIIPKDEPALLSVCAMKTSGVATDVLPDALTFNGSVRAFDEKLHQALNDFLAKTITDLAKKYGAVADIQFGNKYITLKNTAKETAFAADVARDVVGGQAVMTQIPRTLGTEDFAFFLKQRPGNFMAMGTGNASGTSPDLHHPKYDFNDAALPIGATYWVKLVEKRLPTKTPPKKPSSQKTVCTKGTQKFKK